jgi:MFS family permease
MDIVVLGWVVLTLTGSPLWVGVAAFCRAAPMMALGPVAGLVADRVDRGRVLVAVQAASLLAAAALAGLFAAGRGSLGALIGLELVLGAAWALDFPARRSLIPTLLETARVTNAVSLENVSLQAAKMVGPTLGGVLLARGGPAAAYAALAAFHLWALAFTAALAPRLPLPASRPAEPLLAGLAAGLREVRGQPVVRAVLAVTVVMNALVFPYQHLLSVFARDVLLVGPERLGLLVAVDGLGSLAGSLAIASRRGFVHHARLFAAGSLAAAGLVAAFALSPWFALSLPLQFLIGLAEAGFGTMQSTIVLLGTREVTRGRAMGILSACIGTQPLGTLWAGALASQVGAPAAVASGGLAAVLLMLPLARRLARGGPGAAGAPGR